MRLSELPNRFRVIGIEFLYNGDTPCVINDTYVVSVASSGPFLQYVIGIERVAFRFALSEGYPLKSARMNFSDAGAHVVCLDSVRRYILQKEHNMNYAAV